MLTGFLLVCISVQLSAQTKTRVTGAANWNTASTWIQLRTGTIAFTNLSTTVTGTGTSFLTQLQAGDVLMQDATSGTVRGTVASIQSNISLTLTTAATATLGTAAYGRQAVPVASDDVQIGNTTLSPAVNVALDVASATINSLTFIADNLSHTLTHIGTNNLTVNGSVTLNQPTGNNFTVAWNINAGSATVNGLLSFPGTNNFNRITQVVITSGTLNANGGITFATTTKPANKVIDMSGGAGILNLKGALTLSSVATLTAGTLGSVFNYADNVSAQTINFFAAGAYDNLYINNISAGGATLSAAITTADVTENIRVLSGTLFNGGFAIALNGSKTFEVANGATFKLTGTSGMVTGGAITKTFGATSTVDYNGASQTISAENYGNLSVSAGASPRTITLANLGSISVFTNFSPSPTNNTYVVTGSTVTYNGNLAQALPSNFTTYNNLIIANSGNTVTSNANSTVNGDLSVSSGTFDMGSFNANRFSAGGTLTVSNGASLKIGGTNTIPSNYTTHSIGATSTIEYSGTTQSVVVLNSVQDYGNLIISGSGTKTLAGIEKVAGNLTISAGTFDLGSNTINRKTAGGTLAISSGASLKIGGTNTLPSNYTTHSIGATSTIEYSGTTKSVLVLNSSQDYGNLIISGSGTKTLAGTVNVAGNLTISSGTFDLGANTINRTTAGGTLTISSAASLKIGGTNTLPSNYSAHSIGANSTIEYSGTNQSLAVLNSSQDYGNLTVSGSGTKTLAGNVNVAGTLTFTGATITTGANTIYLKSTGSVSRTSGHVIGNFKKYIATGATSKTFETGDVTNYTPVTVAFASVTTAGDLTASVTATDHPNLAGSGIRTDKSVNRYFTLTNTGIAFTTASLTMNWIAGDVDAGSTTANFNVGNYNNPTWTLPSFASPLATSIQATGISSFGDFAAGERCILSSAFSYTASPYCSNGGTATPTITGTAGTFTSTAGLSINSVTGVVNLAASTAGAYVVTNSATSAGGCVSSSTSNITITALPSATISYAGAPFCSNAGVGSVTRTGTGGGTYTASPAGLTINAATGAITPGTSTAGTYTVTYTMAAAGGCSQQTATTSVTITALPVATISYAGTPFCTSAGIGSVTLTGTGGGTYSSIAGLSVNAATGAITPGTSTAGTYTVTYTMAAAGGCSQQTATTSVTITALPAATIAYAGTPFCTSAGVGSVTLTGTSGGTYTSTAGLTINAGTGAITPGTSTPNTYTVTYTVTASGGCSIYTTTTSVTVSAPLSATISYAGTPYCSSGGTATVTRTGAAGGTYTSTAGLTINSATGVITLGTSTAGPYTVTYTMVNGGCTTTATTSVTVTAAPSATISYAGSPYCSGAGTATVTRTGTAGGTYSSTAGLTINSATGDITLGTSTVATYTVTYTVAAAGGCALFQTTTSVSIVVPGTWSGAVSTDWNTAGNWLCGAIPAVTTNVIIPGSLTNYPILNTGTGSAQNITVQSGASLTVTGGTLQIGGVITNNGTFNASNGTIEMTGSSSQTIAAYTFQNNALNNLIISNTSAGGVTLDGALDLYSSLTYTGTGKKLTTNDFLTLKSTATNTAFVGDMTGNTISGKVTVERYISARKAWRLLSVPTNTTQTIQQAWQEGCGANLNCVANFGTQVTGPGGTAAGFDVYTSTPSLKTYNPAINAWADVGNTNTRLIKATDGYMIFIRGDRTAIAFNSTPTQTVLRTIGDLYTGDQAPVIVNPRKFVSIGNPYASALDMRSITKTGVKDFFYVWDPSLGSASGNGAYQTFSYNGTDYVITPGMGSYGANGSVSNYIQSGQAFLIQGTPVGGSLTFKEGAKTSGSALVSVAAGLPKPQLSTSLYGVNADSTTYMIDGVLSNYDDAYSNGVDDMDAIKSINSSENLSIKTANALLVVERRQRIVQQDTIFLNLANVKVQKYRFEFTASQLNRDGQTGFLEDNYLHTSTPLNLDGSTTIDFNIVNIPGSYAANRFRIVFTPAVVLPVSFTAVKAYAKNKDIAVEWNVENQRSLKQYDVEKSLEGTHFTKVSTITAHNTIANNYDWLDTNVAPGYNYYRIKSININGEIKYSRVVKVFIGKSKQEIKVYPNPVINNTIDLQLVGQPAGTYQVKLLNDLGELVLEKSIHHEGGNSTELIPVSQKLAKGIYELQVVKPNHDTITNEVVF